MLSSTACDGQIQAVKQAEGATVASQEEIGSEWLDTGMQLQNVSSRTLERQLSKVNAISRDRT